jgi:hypothetical protein
MPVRIQPSPKKSCISAVCQIVGVGGVADFAGEGCLAFETGRVALSAEAGCGQSMQAEGTCQTIGDKHYVGPSKDVGGLHADGRYGLKFF